MVKEDIVIQSANISYLNEILSIIMDIDDKRNNIMKYNDFEFKHSENSLEEVLNNKNKNEIIFIARHKEKLIGMINILFSNPNYIFFVDKFAYVKYLYVEKMPYLGGGYLDENWKNFVIYTCRINKLELEEKGYDWIKKELGE